jgi:hypothetical protein
VGSARLREERDLHHRRTQLCVDLRPQPSAGQETKNLKALDQLRDRQGAFQKLDTRGHGKSTRR